MAITGKPAISVFRDLVQCCYCDWKRPLFSQMLTNPEAMVRMLERFAAEHLECRNYSDKKLARAAFHWKREMRRLNGSSKSNHSGKRKLRSRVRKRSIGVHPAALPAHGASPGN